MYFISYERKKPVVGETYYICSTYETRRYFKKEGTVEVTKVGNKYFTVKDANDTEYRFDKKTFVHDNGKYSPDISIYNSEEDYKKYVKAKECETELKDRLLRYLTLDEIIELHDKLTERRSNM